MNTIVEVHDLTKTFGATTALDGLSLHVGRGEVAGFLGPNGAGKSTTIRILLGLLRADGGSASVLGFDPWRDAVEVHRHLAYVPGDIDLWPSLTGGEAIDFLCRLRGGADRARRTELVERFELDPRKKCRAYFKGNRQKVALISALASDVELLVLDEPTSGLDPLMERVFQDCVAEAKQRGSSVLLSSHILAEVEKLCDTVTIIRDGRTVESGSLAQLRHLTRSTITVRTDLDTSGLAQAEGVHALRNEHGHTVFEVDNAHLDEVVRRLAEYGVRSLESAPPSLEELFLRHYGSDRQIAGVGGVR